MSDSFLAEKADAMSSEVEINSEEYNAHYIGVRKEMSTFTHFNIQVADV
jgi:hypothetical protein